MSVAAIRTFKYASSSDLICNSDAGMSCLILLDSPCKEGHVRGLQSILTGKWKRIRVGLHQFGYIIHC